METRVGEVVRAADEEVLLVNAVLAPQVLAPVEVQARRAPPGQGEAGSNYRTFSQEVTRRLPLQGTDPNSLARLVAGVAAAGGADSLSTAGGFSAAGQRASQNNVTLDGSSFAAMLSGGGFAALPSEGLRSTRVITST
jgi:hypothetical protein